jgi:transcriptional regulator with GAF, ATPase, and Fis domain
VRVIAATNRALEQAVEVGAFRADLYYRLNVFPVWMPPLRERPEDIAPLALHFAHRFAAKQGKPIVRISPGMLAAMQAYRWPGNVRELQNVVERAAILTRGETLELTQPLGGASAPPAAAVLQAAPRTMRAIEVEAIVEALQACGWVIGGPRGAARRLEMPVTTLRDRIERYAIVREG